MLRCRRGSAKDSDVAGKRWRPQRVDAERSGAGGATNGDEHGVRGGDRRRTSTPADDAAEIGQATATTGVNSARDCAGRSTARDCAGAADAN